MSFAASAFLLRSKPNLLLFHSLLKSHIETRKSESALLVFRHLLQFGLKPNGFTFSLLLKHSSVSSSPVKNEKFEAYQIQSHLIKSGVLHCVYINTALVDLYMKLGCVNEAHAIFDCMTDRDVVSWNALICGYSRNGCDSIAVELFVQMLRNGFLLHQSTLLSLIPSCAQCELVPQGKSVHGFSIKSGLVLDSQVKNALISMYGKCGDLVSAESLFEELVEKSVVSWNSMIGACGQNGFFDEAMHVFKQMIFESVEVNPVTIMSILSVNTNPQFIHCFTVKIGLINCESVVTSLICTYAKFRCIEAAERLYKLSSQKNLVSLTALISCYAETGNMKMVVGSFAQMQQLGMKLDSVVMVSILHGIADPTDVNIGFAFHGYALKSGLDTHVLVRNGLISMYSKFSDVESILSLFYEMHQRTLISWNSVISGCVQNGRASEALDIFGQLKMFGHTPDAITIASLLSGCSQLGYLQFGKKLHDCILRNNIRMEDFVETALVDMYSNCGSVVYAARVFKTISEPCLATWNTMISCYSWYGLEHEALSCYAKMKKQGLKPDRITFLGVLAACTHGGLVDEGRKHFHMMTEVFGMAPTLQHCACMVGLLGRAGLFEEALLFIRKMEIEPDSALWGALLSACCIHGKVKLGECLAKKLYLIDHKNGGLYVLMSNLYAIAGRWDDVAKVREMMRDTGGDGCSGLSQIEVTVKGI